MDHERFGLAHISQLFVGLPVTSLLLTALAIGVSLAVYLRRTRQSTLVPPVLRRVQRESLEQCSEQQACGGIEQQQDDLADGAQTDSLPEEGKQPPDERLPEFSDRSRQISENVSGFSTKRVLDATAKEVSPQESLKAIANEHPDRKDDVQDEREAEGKSSDPPERLPELTDRSRQFLENVSGFLASKRVLDATTKEMLPHKWMELHPSFEEEELMVQKNLQGQKVNTIDELLAVATVAKPVFDRLLHKIVCASGLDPERTVTDKDGQPVMLTHSRAYTVLTLAPLKSVERLVEKVSKELKGDFSKPVDVVRCSVVVFTEGELEKVAQFLKRHEQTAVEEAKDGGRQHNHSHHSEEEIHKEDQENYEVVRLKNRFKTPLFNGYRDALYNIVVYCDNGVTHVCEVQLHLADIVAQKEGTHVFYEYFRTYFSGSRAEASRMQALEKIDGACGGTVDQMISSVLCGSNVEQLNHLGYLIENLMGDVKVALSIRKRILDLNEANSLHKHEIFASQIKFGLALLNAGELFEAEIAIRKGRDGMKHLGNSHPDVLASIGILAVALQGKGKLDEAECLYREALEGRMGASDPDTLTRINNLATLLKSQGKFQEAEPLFRTTLDGRRQLLGNLHPETLTSINNLAILLRDRGNRDEAGTLCQEALNGRRQVLGNSHPETLTSINSLAVFLKDQGKLSAAEPFYREALDGRRQLLGNLHPETLISINNLAGLLKDQGKLSAAEPFYREALDGRKKTLGIEHPDTLASILSLASLLKAQGKLDEAEILHRTAQDGLNRLDDSHPHVLGANNNFALLLLQQGKLTEAEPLLRETLEKRSRLLGNLHHDTLTSMNSLAVLLRGQGKLTEAEPFLQKALSGRRQLLGDSHSETLALISNLAVLLREQGRLAEAEPLFREALDGSRTQLGDSHFQTLTAINNLAVALEHQGKLLEAEPLIREALDGTRKSLGNEHPTTLTSINNLAMFLLSQRRLIEAKPLFLESLEGRRRVLGNNHPDTLASISNFALFHLGLGQLDEAENMLQQAVDGRRALLGDEHPDTQLSVAHLAKLRAHVLARARS